MHWRNVSICSSVSVLSAIFFLAPASECHPLLLCFKPAIIFPVFIFLFFWPAATLSSFRLPHPLWCRSSLMWPQRDFANPTHTPKTLASVQLGQAKSVRTCSWLLQLHISLPICLAHITLGWSLYKKTTLFWFSRWLWKCKTFSTGDFHCLL